jgi:hypothetical protein
MVQTSGIAQRLVVDTTLNVRTESAIPRHWYDKLLPFSLSNICQIDLHAQVLEADYLCQYTQRGDVACAFGEIV